MKAEWSALGKYREIFLDRHLPMSLKRSVFYNCVLLAMMPNMVSYKSNTKEN